MKAKVDKTRCNGTGLCEHICPQIFRVENGTCTVKLHKVPPAALSSCREAEESCPNRAIKMEC
jgi:ferredoxin